MVTYPPAECKHESAHVVPLDPDASAIVEAAMADARTWCPYLFHGPDCAPGRTPSKAYGCVGEFKKAWAAALKAAQLTGGRKAGGYVMFARGIWELSADAPRRGWPVPWWCWFLAGTIFIYAAVTGRDF